MAVVARKSVASLMQKTLDRQAAVARMKLAFQKGQIEKILINYVSNGIKEPYNELVKILQECPLNDMNYKVLLEDCLTCIVLLGRELKLFVDVMCNIEWVSRSEELTELFCKFLLSLVTAHTYHCPKVMACLVKLFREDGVNWEDDPPKKKVKLWSNLHTVIAQIVAIMPLTSDLLMQTVLEQFPYYKAGCYANRAYIHNLIWMTKYIPSLTEQIMAAIVNRMIVMDVNLVEQSKSKPQNDTIFDMEVDMQEQDQVGLTLDCCMLEMLQWLENERDSVLTTFCRVFERIILPTYGIRHIQFLLLFTISIDQQCADEILDSLWILASGLHGLGPGAVSTRRTAASHLAGLLVRCVKIPTIKLIHYLKNMADWCQSYITASHESTSTNDYNNVHGAFHAICHALFYVVAFKHHSLFSSRESINFIESLNLPRLVTCTLNPLRTCPLHVQQAFASVTRAHQLVYCQAIIEKNARNTLMANTVHDYDVWYPYDPYTLPKSGTKIWPLYIEYKHSIDSDESQFSNIKSKLEADDDFLNPSPSQKLASSLKCISPGFRNSETLML